MRVPDAFVVRVGVSSFRDRAVEVEQRLGQPATMLPVPRRDLGQQGHDLGVGGIRRLALAGRPQSGSEVRQQLDALAPRRARGPRRA